MTRTISKMYKALAAAAMCGLILMSTIAPAFGQDLVAVSDISGTSSVFVFKKPSTSAKRFTSTRPSRTTAQRVATAKKIRKQYDTSAKVAPQRVRTNSITPEELPKNIKTMGKAEASKLFAGVGEWYLDRGDLENAIGTFRESATLDAKNTKAKEGLSDALATKGNNFLETDETTKAKSYFLESLKNNPKNALAFYGMGEVFSQLDQNKDAIANYEKALAQDPALTEIYQPLGMLYYQSGEIAKADSLLTKAITVAPDNAETQVFVGSIRLSQNRNDEALAAFKRAQSIDPSMAEAWTGAGDALLRGNKVDDAIAAYRKATTLKANAFEPWASLGAAYMELKNYDEAAKAFQRAAGIKNTEVSVIEGLADAQRLSGNYNLAAGSYRNTAMFMARDPANYSNKDQADIYSKLGFVIGRQCEINQRKFVKCEWPSAITALEKAVQLGGGDPADYANLGWAYYSAARVDTADKKPADAKAKTELARVNLEKAVASNPTYIEGPLLNLGMVRTDLGDYAGAVDALSKVVKKQPKWAFAWNELGIAYRKQDKFKDAVEQYKKAVSVDDNFAAAYYNLGEASIKSNNMGDAKKAYQRLVKLGSTNFANALVVMSGGAVKK